MGKTGIGVTLALALIGVVPAQETKTQESAQPPMRRVYGSISPANPTHKVDPVYPARAKQNRIQGTVRFTLIVNKDGSVQNVQLVSGHPLLVQAATKAVRQWTYKPMFLNGQPVEFVTSADVNFTLMPQLVQQ